MDYVSVLAIVLMCLWFPWSLEQDRKLIKGELDETIDKLNNTVLPMFEVHATLIRSLDKQIGEMDEDIMNLKDGLENVEDALETVEARVMEEVRKAERHYRDGG